MMVFDKKLNTLKAALRKECDTVIRRECRLDTKQVAEWALKQKRSLVIDALADIVCEQMEQRNDDDRVERILRRKPELRKVVPLFRSLSESLSIPAWYLLSIDYEIALSAFKAAELIAQLQAAEMRATADALEAHCERLAPVMDGHAEMTIGEAERLLKQQTDQTISGLEAN
jgi:hypothetical protein